MSRKARKPYHYLAILVSLLIICQSVIATSQTVRVKAQQPAYDTQEANRTAAEKAEEEAKKLDLKTIPITQAIAKWQEVLKYWQLAGDKLKEAKTLWQIAGLYYLRGEYRKSLEYAQQLLSVYEALDDREGKSSAYTLISISYMGLGEYEKAIASLKQFIALSNHSGAITGALSNMAQSYYSLGENQKALDTYNQVLAFWQKKGDVIEKANTLQYLAFFYFYLGEAQKSLDTLQQANTLDPEFKRDRSLVDLIYTSLASYSCSDKLAQLKQPPKLEQSATIEPSETANNNIEEFKQQVQKYRRQESLGGEANFLELLGDLEYKRIGEYQKALNVNQQALQLRRMMGDKSSETETLTSIADILNLQGKKQEAINTLNQALEIQRQIKIRPKEADTLQTLGDVYQSLGAYPQSLDAYKQALSLFQDVGDRRSEIDTLNKIGYIYRKQQDYSSSLQYYQQALALSQTTGNCNQEAKSLDYLGQTYLALGDYRKATSIGNEGISLSRNLGIIEHQLRSEAKILNNLARVAIKQENYTRALELAPKISKLAQESGFRNLEADFLAVPAEAYEALKQPDKAIQTYQEQLFLYRTLGLQPEEAQSLYNIARLQRQSDITQALENIQNAIKIVENLRTTLASPELRTSYFATVQDYYGLYIDILMQLHQQDPTKGYDAQAYHISERARARTLLELLNEANADIRQGADPTLLEQERTLLQKLNAIEKRRIELYSNNQSTQEQKAGIEKERETLLTQYQDIQAQIRATSPRYAALTQPEPLTLAQVQQQLLDDDTILLQYSLGQERSYLWLVSKDGMSSYQLPKQAEIEDKAKAFYNLLLNNNYQLENRGGLVVVPKKVNQQVASELSKILLEPIANQLDKKRLVIVADGALQYIPFATLSLPTTQELLINHYQISYLPSSSSLAIIRQEATKQPKGTKTLAILADPVFSQNDTRVKGHHTSQNSTDDLDRAMLDRSSNDLDIGNWKRLPGTRQEAEAILSLIPSSESMQAFDFGANFATATNPNLSQYRIVHYATHGLLNSVHPELSGVVLSLVDEQGNSQNGFLRLNDIFNLNLGSDLVVLSACQTGLGQEVKGEGLIGLTRGFMYAGSPRVLVSLWNVSDEATAEMMTHFYRLILKEKLPPSQALRQAQLEMQQYTQWQSPYYWAGFILQGEWE